MKILLATPLLITLFFQTTMGQSAKPDESNSGTTSQLKKIAILPFKAYVTLSPSAMEKLSRQEFELLLREEGKMVQGAMFKYLNKRNEKRDLEIQIKPVEEVNDIFEKNQITADDIHKIGPDLLCELLGVDVIVHGRFTSNKVMSNLEAISLSLLVGYLPHNNAGTCKIIVNEANHQWVYETPVSSTFGNDIDTIIDRMMRKAARQLPSFF